MTNTRTLVERLRETLEIEHGHWNMRLLCSQAADELERLTRQRDTYRNACATKQDLIDRLLLQSVPGELSAERKAELRDRPRVTRAELPRSRLEVKHAESDSALEPNLNRPEADRAR